MTDHEYRHYLLIVDRSGSMTRIAKEAQEGIRHFVREQAALPGRATLTLVQFDSVHETVCDFAALEAGSSYELVPRYGTALLDACGRAIAGEGVKLAALSASARPGKVIVLITTDGAENESHEYTLQQVRDIIVRQQEEYGWKFSYVGANVDAFAEAQSMGISGTSTLDYSADSAGTRGAYIAASASAARYSRGQSAGLSYTDQERKEAGS